MRRSVTWRSRLILEPDTWAILRLDCEKFLNPKALADTTDYKSQKIVDDCADGSCRPRSTTQQGAQRARSGDAAVIGISLVIGLDIGEAVEIVDHDARRLPQPLFRFVGEPVEPFEPRTVAEVKMRDGIASAA